MDDARHRNEAAGAASSRWVATLLCVWGAATLVAEFATAFLSGPWTLLPVGAVVLPFAVWATVYALRQRAYPRGLAKRYLPVVGAWTALHLGYVLVLVRVGPGDVAVALIGSVAVAAPLFAGALVESRRR
ncbi:hypothetical protein DEF23_18820 [Marinitenerispora sediminis]|uniref:DUF2568 domain-containing protein n=1 Tax=Marinitenerispora sediminis TaxID=1931232 RepID=A0A368T2W7_9ACTN|nr:hypothetical protein DEF28_23530 [Marinitenerispora sediminis]RCV52518.1 hypothetical protein DEF23_18820 [Marinitenerispora sediminis]RCV56384.1 hypothetical protein DEF24_16710 [Marinitenerispora sediminis]